MNKPITNRVFVDTNVLIDDFFFRQKQKKASQNAANAIRYLRSVPKAELYIASFSIVQVVSTLCKAKINNSIISKEINSIISKYYVVDFTQADIVEAIKLVPPDIEDAFQYIVCQKMRCICILTENAKDFKEFGDIAIIKPKFARNIVIS